MPGPQSSRPREFTQQATHRRGAQRSRNLKAKSMIRSHLCCWDDDEYRWPTQPLREFTMHQPSFRNIVAALSRKLPGPGLGAAVFGARLLVAFAFPSHLLAHENHPPAQPTTPAVVEEAPFLKENDDAMTRMMADMAIKPSGDIDRDFVAMMSPHHQGAINMAISELRYGKNEQLRRIAQEIIVDQMQEIAAMKLAIGEPATDSRSAPTQQPSASTPVEHHRSGLQLDMSSGMKH
jgi:hypothetical protein